MKDEDVEKVRTGLLDISEMVQAQYRYQTVGTEVEKLLALLPPPPKPEPPDGPYRVAWHYALGGAREWYVLDIHGARFLGPLSCEHTARFLARSWAAEELLRKIRTRDSFDGETRMVLLRQDIDRHFEANAT